MKSKPLISVIIVNWNGESLIDDCLTTLLSQNYTSIEVLFVDNNSSDNSEKVVKKYKKVKFIQTGANLGFAGGNNYGLKYAKGTYVLLLNTDTKVSNDFLAKMVEKIESDNELGIVQPKLLYENDRINSIGAYLTNTGFLYYPGYDKNGKLKKYNNEEYVFSAYGACMLIRKSVIEEIGLFDDDYFMYFEETDFCMRAWLAGWKILYIPNASIHHKGAASSKKFGLERMIYHSFKNRICTYIKNFEFLSLVFILSIHIIACEVASLMYLITGRFGYASAVQKALWWNIISFKSTLKKRKTVQKSYRKISDKEYFKHVFRYPRMSYYLYLFKGLRYYKD